MRGVYELPKDMSRREKMTEHEYTFLSYTESYK